MAHNIHALSKVGWVSKAPMKTSPPANRAVTLRWIDQFYPTPNTMLNIEGNFLNSSLLSYMSPSNQ